MKFSTVILAAAAAVGASAQIDLIPDCAWNGLLAAFPNSGCSSVIDYDCLCNSATFIAEATPLVEAACSASEVQITRYALKNLCLEYGVTLPYRRR